MVTGQTTRSGRKNDTGKLRWELLPYDAIDGIVQILTDGAVKYDDRNWEQGMKWSRVYAAIMRHLGAWWMGKLTGHGSMDKESGHSHLWHAGCEILFLIAYEKRKMGEFDDRPTKVFSKEDGGNSGDHFAATVYDTYVSNGRSNIDCNPASEVDNKSNKTNVE